MSGKCVWCKTEFDESGLCKREGCNLFGKYVPDEDSGTGNGNVYKSSIPMTTTSEIQNKVIKEYKGIVYSSSSQIAGLEKQQTRMKIGLERVLQALENEALGIGANAVVGINITANSSTGTALNILGSSDSITVIGTAVLVAEI